MLWNLVSCTGWILRWQQATVIWKLVEGSVLSWGDFRLEAGSEQSFLRGARVRTLQKKCRAQMSDWWASSPPCRCSEGGGKTFFAVIELLNPHDFLLTHEPPLRILHITESQMPIQLAMYLLRCVTVFHNDLDNSGLLGLHRQKDGCPSGWL